MKDYFNKKLKLGDEVLYNDSLANTVNFLTATIMEKELKTIRGEKLYLLTLSGVDVNGKETSFQRWSNATIKKA